jgi:uncharacterized Zn finger protein
MPRESIDEKALRYLREHRVRVTHIEDGRVYARARGERAVYDLSFKRNGRAWCTCPARVRCAHLVALEFVGHALKTIQEAHPAPEADTPPPATATAVATTSTQPARAHRDAYRHERYHASRAST